jgi:OmcA/MtrC family decaheme c-type cytochrome
MNDVHNSHAFEFNYPQLMSNCVTCHAGKLTNILTDANFKPTVCKSCHPVTGKPDTMPNRAPSFASIWAGSATHAGWDPSVLYTSKTDTSCNGCHAAGNAFGAPTFAELHKGYDEQIYADPASANSAIPFSASRKAQVDSASYDAASFVATVAFSIGGIPTSGSVVVPTVVSSLYGYGTKDFIVSGHDKTAGVRNLEATFPTNTARVTIAQGANSASFVATLNLSMWAGMITSGQVKRIEVGILPAIGVDPTLALTTSNPAAVVAGVAQTLDVTKTAADARIAADSSYGKTIVDPANCNKCHDALGTTFHSPLNGSAGVVGCRLCHAVPTGAGYFEMQSRSIDSFLHAAHSMQQGSISGVDPTNAVSLVRYEKHIEGVYPNFAGPLNCESCHSALSYDPPGEDKSLPGVISKSSGFMGGYPRTVGVYALEITGPAARACGACHRAMALNETDGAKLAAFVEHTNTFGSGVFDATALVSTAAYLQYMVGASATAVAAPAGAQPEQCQICHPTAGQDHQNLFNVWKKGL